MEPVVRGRSLEVSCVEREKSGKGEEPDSWGSLEVGDFGRRSLEFELKREEPRG